MLIRVRLRVWRVVQVCVALGNQDYLDDNDDSSQNDQCSVHLDLILPWLLAWWSLPVCKTHLSAKLCQGHNSWQNNCQIYESICITRSLQYVQLFVVLSVLSQINCFLESVKGRKWVRVKSIYNAMYIKQTYQPSSEVIPFSLSVPPLFYSFPLLFIWVIILLAYFWSKHFLGCSNRTHYIKAFSDRTSCAWHSERI